jgi:hypothetical protein
MLGLKNLSPRCVGTWGSWLLENKEDPHSPEQAVHAERTCVTNIGMRPTGRQLFFLCSIGFELRTLCLQDRQSTT